MQTEEVLQLRYILLKSPKICVTSDSCIIQRPKNYHNFYSPDDRILLVTNNNKAISQSNLGNKNNKDYV